MLERAGRLSRKANHTARRDFRRNCEIRGTGRDDPDPTSEPSRGYPRIDDGSTDTLRPAEEVTRHMADEHIVRSEARRTLCSPGRIRRFGWGRG
jgi:hypothetical protein